MPDHSLNVLFLIKKVTLNDGTASYLQTLMEGMAKYDVGITMVSGHVYTEPETEWRRKSLDDNFVAWHKIPDLDRIPKPAQVRQILKIIKDRKITVINVHGLGMLMWGRLLATLSGARFVASYHPSVPLQAKDTGISTNPFSRGQRLWLRAFVPDRLVVLSSDSASFLKQQCGLLNDRIVHTAGGIDTNHFRQPGPTERAQARADLGLDDQDLVCALVGRLTWNKGHDLLIEAVRRIKVQRPDLSVKCLFVGTGEQEQALKDAAAASGTPEGTFRFFGYVKDFLGVLWASDIFTMPSRVEGFALAVAEAMATGLVPVRTPSGGAADQIIEGQTGFVVPFEDAETLAQSIIKLSDPVRRRTMAAASAERARKRFSQDVMVADTYALYRSLASKGRPAAAAPAGVA